MDWRIHAKLYLHAILPRWIPGQLSILQQICNFIDTAINCANDNAHQNNGSAIRETDDSGKCALEGTSGFSNQHRLHGA